MGKTTWNASGGWKLPAPETLVLLEGDACKPTEPFKLALVELLARGTYRLVKEEKRGGMLRRKPKTHIVPGAKHNRPNDASLAAVYELIESSPHKAAANGESGVELMELAQAAKRRFGSLSGYTGKAVWPALMERGMAEERQGRALFVIPTKKRVLTPAGESAREQGRVLRQTADQGFGRLVDEDPSGALALATSAGSIVLLTVALYPSLARLKAAATVQDDVGDAGTAAWVGTSDDVRTDDQSLPTLDGLDFDAVGLELDALGLDFDALDGLADFSADVDAGFDSAGGDGGGDGGGGSD